jgi:phenylpyruvate tautomerase PptA (4-oxalocrotonate tautomerase family)
MPILDVELVLAPGETPVSDLAARLADAAGQVFGSEPRRTWVKLRFMEAGLYAENNNPAGGIYPVFVTVLKSRLPIGGELESEIKSLTEALAEVCDRSLENVHIFYQPEGAGRVAFGGNLIGP